MFKVSAGSLALKTGESNGLARKDRRPGENWREGKAEVNQPAGRPKAFGHPPLFSHGQPLKTCTRFGQVCASIRKMPANSSRPCSVLTGCGRGRYRADRGRCQCTAYLWQCGHLMAGSGPGAFSASSIWATDGMTA